MRPGRSSLPRLALLADPESDDIHRPMQGGRDKDDDKEPEQRVSGEKTRDRPRGNREAEHQGADDEIVLVEDGGFAPRGLCIRRLRNAPVRSPRSAPKARTAEAPNATPTGPNDHVEFGAKR